MNPTALLALIITIAVLLAGCGSSEVKEQPIMATGGMTASSEVIEPAPEEAKDPQPAVPVAIPRVEQAQIVGVIRELRTNGCIIKKVASTDGIHYSQLIVTCGDVQKPPQVQ